MTSIPSPRRKPANRWRGLLALFACVSALSAVAATSRAEVVTARFDFTATGFVDIDTRRNATPPFTSASGSFTVTFDPTGGQVLNRLGVVVNSWSPVLSDSAVAYTYLGSNLYIGGIASGGVHGQHNFGINDHDFRVGFAGVPGTPTFYDMLYKVPDNDGWFRTYTGSLTMTPVVPEPASLAFIAMALAPQRRPRRSK